MYSTGAAFLLLKNFLGLITGGSGVFRASSACWGDATSVVWFGDVGPSASISKIAVDEFN